MTKRLTQEEFLRRAKAVHAEKYDLSRAIFTNIFAKVEVVCPTHGPWMVTPSNFFKGNGCPKCGVKSQAKTKSMTQEEFVARAKKVHGDSRYDFSRARYVNNHTKVEVICPKHGSWMVTPNNFLNGSGCPKCVGRNITQAEFERRANEIHKGKYDLSRTRYVNNSTKIEVVCPEHGSWWVTPANFLLRKSGCPKCGKEKVSRALSMTQKQFEARVREIHGNKYDLSRAWYVNDATKVEVMCPEHGSWWVRPNGLFYGKGCPECGSAKASNSRRLAPVEFEKRVREIHGDKYDLSRIRYVNIATKVEIVCPEHGAWWPYPSSLLKGCGCPKCAGRAKLTQQEFELRVRKVHGDKYDLSRALYANNHERVEVICHEHGPSWVTPANLFGGQGCRRCGNKKISEKLSLTQKEFESRISSLFGEKADFSKAVYKGIREKVTMRCTVHDEEFEAPPDSLFTGAWGCPECWNNGKSKGEDEVAAFLDSLGLDLVVLRNVRDVIPPKELDIYIPEKNLAVEYNGIYHHHDGKKSRSYHMDKYLACRDKGIRLIQILDFAWETRQAQIKSILANALGARTNERKIDARKCEVRQVKVGELRDFFDANHIQGHVYTASLALGLFYEDEVVAAMTFSKGGNQRGAARVGRQGAWTLSRYATSRVVRGGFQKLLKHGRDLIGWEHDIVSFSANDYFQGGAYESAGFEREEEVGPDYQVFHPKNGLHHKSHWQRRHIPAMLAEIGWGGDFDPDTDPRTEWELEDQVGAVRVYDSGKRRWRLRGVDKSRCAV